MNDDVELSESTEAPMNDDQSDPRSKTIEQAIAESDGTRSAPVTFERCDHVVGPFFHGTKVAFRPGELVVVGHPSNYHRGRVANHVYFAALLEPAVWAAELATAFAERSGSGRIYVVEPTGPFEDDPNVTDKRFPGNVTQSYRTPHPMRVVEEVATWDAHTREQVQTMVDGIMRLRAQGLDVIED